MINATVTPDWLVVVAGFLLSLAFSYIPKLNTWYAKMSEEVKKLVMAGLILVTLIVVFVLQCYGYASTNMECSVNGVLNALITYSLALAANQGTYGVSPKTNAVKTAIKIRDARKAIGTL